ncbi:MAG: serine hydrolase domain-containing protein [Pseudomonadota bacterium]
MVAIFLATAIGCFGPAAAWAQDDGHDYAGYARVAWSADGTVTRTATGEAEPGRAFDADAPVRIASISKLVATIGLLKLVDAGQIDWDADVADLLGWPLRNPAAPDISIRLSDILSHRAGLTDAGGYVVPLGTRLEDFIGPDHWRGTAPGGAFEYANLGSAIIASVMERATGERFDRLMQRLVFAPLAIDACYNWSTCSTAARERGTPLPAPTGEILRDDRSSRLDDCQVARASSASPCPIESYSPGTNGSLFSPQGGLRISVADLATLGRALATRDARLLSADSYALLFGSPARFGMASTEDAVFCRYGFTIQALAAAGCPAADAVPARLGHSGEAYHLRSGLWFDPDSGAGVAFAITGVPDPGTANAGGLSPIERAALLGTLK